MKKFKRLMSLLMAALMMLAMVAQLVACETQPDNPGTEEPGKTENPGQTATYTVSVKSAGGLPMKGVTVYIYDGDNIKAYKDLDENGNAEFSLPASPNYKVELSKVPDGYIVEPKENYSLGTNGVNIVLVSNVVKNDSNVFKAAKPGDIMRDFTVTDLDGNKINLAELLKTKKAVLINFWFVKCQYCVEEFPGLNAVYEKYKDDIEIVALNVNGDSQVDMKHFRDNFKGYYESYFGASDMPDGTKLSFPMGADVGIASDAFGLEGAPVSVMIDRYGMISLIHSGAISEAQFENMFAHYAASDYKQATYTDVTQLVPKEKPNVTMPSSDEIAAAVNSGSIKVTYAPELDSSDAEYSWPFMITTKNGVKCIAPANGNVDGSYAILHANVELKKDEAFVFDYYSSGNDMLYVLVDGDDIYQITGVKDKWIECCPWVAIEDGTYDVALVYVKDDSDAKNDNDIYFKDFRVTDKNNLSEVAYIPREAATNPTEDMSDYKNYVNVVFNEKDGYYHVGTADGPILIVRLIYNTRFSDTSVTENLINNHQTPGFMVDGVNVFDTFYKYCNYAANSKIYSYCSVTQELRTFLEQYVKLYGFNTNENTWLQLCSYYDTYGKDENGNAYPQLADVIKGLSAHSAYDAVLGDSNKVEYEGMGLIPRGYLYEFIPDKTGVYRLTSKNTTQEVVGWIFAGGDKEWIANGDRILYTSGDEGERFCQELIIKDKDGNLVLDNNNVSMVAYMEAGTPYYIDFAYYDIYGAGSFNFEIKYVGETYDYFISCSPGPFTFILGPNEEVGDTITGGIDVMLGSDGYYYHKKADGSQGSPIYADFFMTTSIFTSYSILDMIENHPYAFEVMYSELDHVVLDRWQEAEKDIVKLEEILRAEWGEDFDEFWNDVYLVEEVIAGKYHGNGGNLLEEFKEYAKKVIESGEIPELQGCVKVDKRLAEMLQDMMDKYTFRGVENSWIKLCYYYDYLGK